jgi:murein DD-endopeptidase MepM/ murein hydrolase activator NlpD
MRRLMPVAVVCTTLATGCAPMPTPPLPDEAPMIRPSGLRPVFPARARCSEIASPFGAGTRYDGSPRPKRAFGGLHGGIDISLVEGTPVLAMAAGEVVSKGEGGRMEGVFLWLRHSPEDTGLPYWVYSKYQHLQSPPELAIGARVAMGEVVARSGKTGTTGGHYGAAGYPHLHLTTRTSPTGDQDVGSRESTQSGTLVDPLVIYREASATPGKSIPPPGERAVTIPYSTTDGHVWPPGTRVVWPVPCQPVR